MTDEWTIQGQAGKAVDATPRTLAEMQAEGVRVEFASLAEDRMVWTLWLDEVEDATGILPEIGQTMSLYKNATRYFHGHVTRRAPRFSAGRRGYTIIISGPWYFLANTSISSQIPDQTTAQQERAVYLFARGSPAAHLAALVNRANDLGMPISLGSIATVFDVPRLSLREMSFAEAISEIMRWVADGLVYFDYSGSGHPALCMQRRNTATSITLNTAVIAVPEISITPRVELQIEELGLYWARRETYQQTRATAWQADSSGTSTSILPSRQIVTVTGPEIDTFLPQDFADSVVVQSEFFDVGRALARDHDILRSANANIAATGVQFEDIFGGSGGGLSGGGVVLSNLWPDSPVLSITDRDGNPVNLAAWPFALTLGEARNWWEKDGIEFLQARVTATVYESQINGPADWHPLWAQFLDARLRNHLVNGGQRNWYQATVSTTVTLVKQLWVAPTTLIRSEDWGWFNPPPGLAENLLATQNWLPYEGLVPIATDDLPPGNAVGSVLNISNWLPETASMRAMIAGYDVTPATGQATYRLGPPARHAYRDLVNRFRQSGADNIFYITGEGITPTWPTPANLPSGSGVFTGSPITYEGAGITYTP